VKVAEVAPAATATEAGTVSAVLLEVSFTDAPAGHAAVIDTVQVVDPLEARLLAPQLTEDNAATGAAAAMVMATPAVALCDALSATCAVALKFPAALGVPPIVPPLDRLNPPGRDPEIIDHV
jgi:hypothetical protein